MRFDLLEAIAQTVNEFQARPEMTYDYAAKRKRRIFEALTEGVYYVYNNSLNGPIAEFGTDTGFSALTICKAMSVYERMFGAQLRKAGVGVRALYLFDSFQGLPRPDDPVDVESPYVRAGRWGTGDFQGLTPEELVSLCSTAYDKAQLKIVPGWYSKTLGQIPPGMRFSMVHLDCDLYSSTAEVLDHLARQQLLADGCAVFFDDWNCNRSSPRFGQRRAWQETVQKHQLRYSDCGEYAILGHKFIVHIDA